MRSIAFSSFQMNKLEEHLKKEDSFAVLVMLGGISLTVKDPIKFDQAVIIGQDVSGDDFIFSADALVGASLSFGDPEDDEAKAAGEQMWQEAFATLRIACANSEDPDVKAALATLEGIETNGAN